MYRAGSLLTFGDFMAWQTGTENQNVKHWRDFSKIPWMNLIVWLKNRTDSFLQPPNILLGRCNLYSFVKYSTREFWTKRFLKGRKKKEYQKRKSICHEILGHWSPPIISPKSRNQLFKIYGQNWKKKYLHVPDECFFTFFAWHTICIEPEETAKILQCYHWFPCEV